MSKPSPPAKMPSFELRGLRFMMSASPCSMPSARAGKQSVIRLMNSRWTGLSRVKPSRVAQNTPSTSLMLEASRNWMALRMLA